MALHQRSW